MSTLATTQSQARSYRNAKRFRTMLWTLAGILLTALFLFPFYMILNSSLMAQTDVLRYPPPLVPPQITFEGYTKAFEKAGEYIRTSLIYGFGTVLVTMLIATPAAYSLARIRSRVGLLVLIALIMAQMAPGIVVANSLYAMFSKIKIYNSYLAVILAAAHEAGHR